MCVCLEFIEAGPLFKRYVRFDVGRMIVSYPVTRNPSRIPVQNQDVRRDPSLAKRYTKPENKKMTKWEKNKNTMNDNESLYFLYFLLNLLGDFQHIFQVSQS